MITLRHLTAGYGRQPVTLPLNGVFRPGSLTAVIGANGSGKSTLLKTLAGLQPPVSGAVQLARSERRQLAFLPQQADLDRQFPLLVEDVVAMGLLRHRGVFGRFTRHHRQQVVQALGQVGMAGFAREPIGRLSGGQFQRVLFARLLVQQAPLILLDEPFTGIDAATVRLLLDLIAGWHAQQRTVIAVLHDIEMVSACFPQTLLLHPQGNAWGNTAQVLVQQHGRAAEPPAENGPVAGKRLSWGEAAL
ncbi:MAG: ABC transporter ATP-binding protein [Yersiniaceae bacterium]|nr:ABC transporter ATP-binding protein [Yersiniaceae bacterium]